jgi:hypothetical protein
LAPNAVRFLVAHRPFGNPVSSGIKRRQRRANAASQHLLARIGHVFHRQRLDQLVAHCHQSLARRFS